MLKRGTLNLLCGGPSAGKTTLTYQAILAHERNEPFFIPALQFPPGPVLVINTDRSKVVNQQFFDTIGIKATGFISIVDDRSLHNLTRPQKSDVAPLEFLRRELTNRISKLNPAPSTIILDLYGDFISGNAGNHKALAYDGRCNVQWAEDMDVAILGLAYPYKQKAGNAAMRPQDRIAGATTIQASSNWKFNITDATETKTCWLIDVIPPPMGGPMKTYYALRAEDADGVGRFHECDPPPQQSLDEIAEQNGVSEKTARKYRSADISAWLEGQKEKSPPS